jgi:hypothetical protein
MFLQNQSHPFFPREKISCSIQTVIKLETGPLSFLDLQITTVCLFPQAPKTDPISSASYLDTCSEFYHSLASPQHFFTKNSYSLYLLPTARTLLPAPHNFCYCPDLWPEISYSYSRPSVASPQTSRACQYPHWACQQHPANARSSVVATHGHHTTIQPFCSLYGPVVALYDSLYRRVQPSIGKICSYTACTKNLCMQTKKNIC